ncbi:hypothetical protein GCM10009767_09390 [Kocuria aegyptia]|uniref:Uncharacterized protein n=1 Tax=Kocuria aegyptia TaxID=330943 RepID=A0ABP4WDY4_9MICC
MVRVRDREPFLNLLSKLESQAVSCSPGGFDVGAKPNNDEDRLHDKPYRFRHFSPKPLVVPLFDRALDLWSNVRAGAGRQRTTGRVALDTS